MRTLLFIFLSLVPLGLFAQEEKDNDLSSWPKEITETNYTITLYQPQLDAFEQNTLSGRMAVSVEENDNRVFGALFFEALLSVDKEERMVYLENLDILDSRFADQEKVDTSKMKELIESAVDEQDYLMPLDKLVASLEQLAKFEELAGEIENKPPKVVFRTTSSALVTIDGDPIWKESDQKGINYVVNTPFFIVEDTKSNTYYLKGGDFWYETTTFPNGWNEIKKAPKKIRKLADKVVNEDEQGVTDELEEAVFAPEIIVVTEPTELIQTDGDPKYEPIKGTDLLFVTNSQDDIVTDVNTNEHYVLLAGRWYNAKQLEDGSWGFVEPDKLPDDFSKIPEDSDASSVRVSVPGTPEAKSALLEQSIPQTATIDRKSATIDVQFDGNPKFEPIEGTSMLLAVNSDKTVLQSQGKYYAVDNGVWFEANSPSGPWTVATERPNEVSDIPPSSPAYNTKYVYIYDSTPDAVYVGYLPGYTGSYIYNGVVVYGTGFYYRPWYGRYYYPRPVTWGFNVHYNPWTGWGFSFGYSYGWFSFGWHSNPYWWGPSGYRYGYRHGYYHGYRHGYRYGYARGYYAGRRTSTYGPRPATYNNVYRNRANGVRSTGVRPGQYPSTRPGTRPSNRPSTGRPSTRPSQPSTRPSTRPSPTPGQPSTRPSTRPSQPSTRPAPRPSTRPNNVYSDRSGNVYRRNNGNWQQRNNGQWQRSTRPSTNQQLNRSYQNRNLGTRNYNRAQQARPAPRPAPRTGGRRRGG